MRPVFLRLALCLLLVGTAAACAGSECSIHSDCDPGSYCGSGACRIDCRLDLDCPTGLTCSVIGQCTGRGDASVDSSIMDSSRPDMSMPDAGPRDTSMPDTGPADTGPADTGPADTGPADTGPADTGPADTGPADTGPADTGPADTGPADTGPADTGPPPGRYLDRCTVGADCESMLCTDDEGATRLCSMDCTAHTDCAVEHLCSSGQCVPNDTGDTCTMASDCALNLCAGNPATGVGECTRTCTTASDCPAGYACSDAGGVFVCVDIEVPCSECGTGLCLTAAGCTTTCRTAADCPTTFAGLAYACVDDASGLRICLPSAAIIGSDPVGSLCRDSGGSVLCRSGACIDDFGGTARCTQRCTETGGCGPGLGCFPADDGGGGVVLVCQATGTLDVGETCASDGQCRSGICNGVCSRLCTTDLFCPTDLTCRPEPVGVVSTCRP